MAQNKSKTVAARLMSDKLVNTETIYLVEIETIKFLNFSTVLVEFDLKYIPRGTKNNKIPSRVKILPITFKNNLNCNAVGKFQDKTAPRN